MIYALRGRVSEIREGFFVMECSGIFFKVLAGERTITALSEREGEVKIFCATFFRENASPELFGFFEEESLRLFDLLHSVSGIGPKTALRMLDLGSVPNIIAAIMEGDAALLSTVPGIGKRTAERVILELRGKVTVQGSGDLVQSMKMDADVEDALVGLGYSRDKVKEALRLISKEVQGFQDRFKAAIKELRH